MDLYLDSADLREIGKALSLGFVKGLTTTPTFMRRGGAVDVDSMIVDLSRQVPELHVEALGDSADAIVAEAERIISLPGLTKEPVFKIPVSLHGLSACSRLTAGGHRVNVHLVYTLNQAWMAFEAGADFVCVLAGRLQDQGHDAVILTERIVSLVERGGYAARVMFSSVRHPDHVVQAAMAGAHVCTIPWRVLEVLPENDLTSRGANAFLEDTRLLTLRVIDVIRSHNPVCRESDTVARALVEMTDSRTGAVSVVDSEGRLLGVFTDGDVRRRLQNDGPGIVNRTMADTGYTPDPVSIGPEASLLLARELFQERQVDNIVVVDGGRPLGILDIQDLIVQRNPA